MRRIAGAAVLLLAGCVAVYKSSDVIKGLERSQRHLSEYSGKIDDDFAQKSRIHATLVSSGGRAADEPYVGMRQDLAEMEPLARRIRSHAEEAQRMHADAQKRLAGNSRIKSDEPVFKEVEAIRVRLEAIGSEAEAIGNEYKRLSDRFVERSRSHRIYEVDVPQIRAQVEKQVGQLMADVARVRSEFGTVRAKADRAASTPEARAAAQRRIDALAEILKAVEARGAEADAISVAFTKEVGTQAKLFVAPHMVCHTVLMRLQEKVGQTNAEIAKFNTAGAELVKSLGR